MPANQQQQFHTETDFESKSPLSDARLVDECRRGNQAAFGELVQRYERRLMRVIRRFVRDEDLAEDLAQETFLRVYERLEQFDTSRRFGPWLFRIGVNLTLDHLRKKKRRGLMSLFSDSRQDRWPDPGVSDPRDTIDLHQEVRAVIEEMPEKYRTVLVLRDLENFSSSEIAAILDRKEATIRWRLAEARNRFQELWERRQQQIPVLTPNGETPSDS
ncbi:MAG: sigma-70 family RNA polymerase sigma factor [Planctomycetaceae bacterium]|nr:sigma-70 family RNA polymerase sigma factor [Planctomycetaceae bacterium]